MSVAMLVGSLEDALRAEVDGRRAQLALLARQEAAIRANDSLAHDVAARELLAELDASVTRAARRETLLRELSRVLEVEEARVEPIALALGSDGDGLLRQRQELRSLAAECLSRGRRLAVLVKVHGGIVEESLARFLQPEPGGAPLGRGSLVDARA